MSDVPFIDKEPRITLQLSRDEVSWLMFFLGVAMGHEQMQREQRELFVERNLELANKIGKAAS